MPDSVHERYSRQIKLPQVGIDGQRALLASRALIVGMGGLGSPVAMYLAAAGVGHLVISDFDRVDLSNLQRQIVHDENSLGDSKASSAKRRLMGLNSATKIDAYDYELDGDELTEQVAACDVVVDCTDNFTSRFALNRLSIDTRTPLVSAAAVRWEAQVSTFDPRKHDAPCYQCLYPDPSVEAATCAAEGVMAPLVGIAGGIQAMEAVKVLLNADGTLCGRLLLIDGLGLEFTTLQLPKNPACPACG